MFAVFAFKIKVSKILNTTTQRNYQQAKMNWLWARNRATIQLYFLCWRRLHAGKSDTTYKLKKTETQFAMLTWKVIVYKDPVL